MKKIILTFGLISGVISSVLMCASLPLLRDTDHGSKAMAVTYAAMVLSFLLVYFGIRSYRDNDANGTITFGRAFLVGISITLISCVFYVVTWEILYFNFLPHGFMDSYFTHQIQHVQTGPGSPEAIQAKVAAIRQSQQSYNNPLINALYTFIEPFPVGLLITLLSAAILRRKARQQSASLPATA